MREAWEDGKMIRGMRRWERRVRSWGGEYGKAEAERSLCCGLLFLARRLGHPLLGICLLYSKENQRGVQSLGTR